MARELAASQAAHSTSRSPIARIILALGTAVFLGWASSSVRSLGGGNGQQSPVRSQEAPGLQPPEPEEPDPAPAGLQGPELSDPIDLPSTPPGIEEPVAVTHMDKTRFRLALCTVAILAFVVVAAFASLWQGQAIENLTRLLEILFAPLVAVVTAVVAFYYRS
jgi:hypothetical protein